jgi:uncharacterized membrane protein YdjX (TVP38/TMEM64 family)
MKKDSAKNVRNIIIGALTLAVPIALIIIFSRDLLNIERHIPKTGIAGPLFSILLMGILSATPIPTDPIVILNGAIFGPWIGVLVSWMGNNLASVLEYFIGKGLGQITDFEKIKKGLPFGPSWTPNSPIRRKSSFPHRRFLPCPILSLSLDSFS